MSESAGMGALAYPGRGATRRQLDRWPGRPNDPNAMNETISGHSYCPKCERWHWAGGFCNPLPKWHCNNCGHDFKEADSESVEDGISGECCIACPKCWANELDEHGALTCLD